MSTCKKCGKEIPEDSVFCPFCGNTLERGDTTELHNNTTINGSAPSSISYLNQADKKTRKKTGWIVAVVILCALLVPAIWLYHSATHYSSPIPQLNAACARCIADYHNLRIGMSYSEVRRILGDSIVQEQSSDEYKYIVTHDKINFGVSDSNYEVCAFKDDVLLLVDIVFESETLYRDDDAISEHFSSLFGEAYHDGVLAGSYHGKNLDIAVDTSDYQPTFGGLFNAKIEIFFE